MMAKSKQTEVPVPLRGSKPNHKAAKTPSKPNLSSEYINDSDDSAVEANPAKEQKAQLKKKAATTIGVHKPGTNGVTKKSAGPQPTPKAPAKKEESEESDSESSSSEESSGETATSKETKKSIENGASGTATTSASDSSEESSSESEDEAAPISRAEAVPQKSQSHTVEFRPALPFEPPKGFRAIPTPLKPRSDAGTVFENLEGKQIWHITAPAGLSLSELKKITMDKALAGAPILSDNGIDYGFVAGQSDELGEREVLIPRQNGYKAVSSRISKTLHIQQVIKLPKLAAQQAQNSTGSEAAESITRSTIRAPRPQLKGLRMRYFHSGFGDPDPGTLGSSDSEPDASAPQSLNKPEKRKHEHTGDSPAKKHKKHRTPEEIKKREEKKAKRMKQKGNGVS